MTGKDTCLRCGGTMELLGHEKLQLGQIGFFTGVWGNLMAGALEVEIRWCAACGKLEFYSLDLPPEDRIAQITCPECGQAHDMDYPKCPACGHRYV